MNTDHEPNRFEKNRKSAWLIVTILCLAMIEIVIRVGVALEIIPIQTYPTNREPQFWANIDPIVGRWRYPNASFRNVFSCFDETYRTNSVGARDPERTLESSDENRVVVLGDSFTEGWGVADGDRVTDILEAETGIEHLNFGTSSWGTIQQWLYYENYARDYDHSAVLLLMLPSNDFHDNDPGYQNPNLYRPYLRKTGDGYEVWYTVDFDKRFTGANGTFEVIKNTIDNNWYLANILRTSLRLLKDGTVDDAVGPENDYDNYTAPGMDRLLYVFGKIAELAGDRPFYIATIPSEKDFNFARENGVDFKLIESLEAFAEKTGNVHVIDLLPYFIGYADTTGGQYGDFTHSCDYHWSAKGNRVAADALLEHIYGQVSE